MNTAKSLTTNTGKTIPFLQHTPLDTLTLKPLYIFFHGIGEEGTNPLSIEGVTGSLPNLIKTGTWKYPDVKPVEGYCLCPQLPDNSGDWNNLYVTEMLKYAKANLNIDPTRIYLDGLSLGGGAVWMACQDPVIAAQITAIAPMCGIDHCNGAAVQNIKANNIAVWIFHAANDGAVGPYASVHAYNDLKAAGCKEIYFTYYADGNHGIWGRGDSPTFRNDILVSPGLQDQKALTKWMWYDKYKIGAVPLPVPNPNPIADAVIILNIPDSVSIDPATGKGSLFVDASGSQNVAPYPQIGNAYEWGFFLFQAPWNGHILSPAGVYGGAKKTFSNLSKGKYRVTLTVKGANGKVVTASKEVSVIDAVGPVPVKKVKEANATLVYDDGSSAGLAKPLVKLDINNGTASIINSDGSKETKT